MASQPHTLITAEQFYQLPQEDGREFELLDGEVIEMSPASPRHSLAVTRLAGLMFPGLRGRGEAVHNTDFSDGKTTTLRPDLAILIGENVALVDVDMLPVTVVPDIVAEVLLYSDTWSVVNRRIAALFRFGVQEIWLVDPFEHTIKICVGTRERRLEASDTLETPLLPGWSVRVGQIFER